MIVASMVCHQPDSVSGLCTVEEKQPHKRGTDPPTRPSPSRVLRTRSRERLKRKRLPLRIREILYGSVLGRRDARTVLSSTYPHNELMRLWLLRWQSERRSAVLRPRWRVGITFSFNPRFLRVRTSDYQQRKYSLA